MSRPPCALRGGRDADSLVLTPASSRFITTDVPGSLTIKEAFHVTEADEGHTHSCPCVPSHHVPHVHDARCPHAQEPEARRGAQHPGPASSLPLAPVEPRSLRPTHPASPHHKGKRGPERQQLPEDVQRTSRRKPWA